MTKTQENKQKREAVAVAGRWWLPTIPYTLVDAVNRAAAATGSVRYAQLSADASYNGHHVSVYYNDYRNYFLCEHYWGERVVHARGEMAAALRAGKYEYDLGHRGTVVVTCDLTPEEADYARSLGYTTYTKEIEEAHNATWMTDLYGLVGEAMGDARWGMDTTHLLLKAKDARDYHEMKQRSHADQVLGAGRWKECRIVGPEGQQGMVLSGEHARTREGYAMVMVDGSPGLSGPVASARTWWRERLAEGWRAAS